MQAVKKLQHIGNQTGIAKRRHKYLWALQGLFHHHPDKLSIINITLVVLKSTDKFIKLFIIQTFSPKKSFSFLNLQYLLYCPIQMKKIIQMRASCLPFSFHQQEVQHSSHWNRTLLYQTEEIYRTLWMFEIAEFYDFIKYQWLSPLHRVQTRLSCGWNWMVKFETKTYLLSYSNENFSFKSELPACLFPFHKKRGATETGAK